MRIPTPDARRRFAEALEEVVERCLQAGTVPVLYTLHREIDGDLDPAIAVANAEIRALADRLEVPLVENDLDAPTQPEFFYEDGVHTNDAGHRLLAEWTVDTLIDYFTRGR